MKLLRKIMGLGKKREVKIDEKREIAVCSECFEPVHDCLCSELNGAKRIGIDRGLHDLIALLNSNGYETKFCCEGHTRYNDYPSEIPYYAVTGAYIEFINSVEVQQLLMEVNKRMKTPVHYSVSNTKVPTVMFGYPVEIFNVSRPYKREKVLRKADKLRETQLAHLRKAFCEVLSGEDCD